MTRRVRCIYNRKKQRQRAIYDFTTHTRARAHTHTHTGTHIQYTHTWALVRTHIHGSTSTGTCKPAHAQARADKYRHAHTHAHARTHMMVLHMPCAAHCAPETHVFAFSVRQHVSVCAVPCVIMKQITTGIRLLMLLCASVCWCHADIRRTVSMRAPQAARPSRHALTL